MLHGEPSWSYLYRKMIPILVAAGHRARRARSRRLRPLRQARASATTTPTSATSTGCAAVLEALDLRDITLVGQDWGGLIGLRLVAEHPDRFARVVAANTFLPTGDTRPRRGVPRLAEVLAGGRRSSTSARIVQGGCTTSCRPRSSPPTTRRSPTNATRRARGSSRCWCRRRPTTRRRRRTARRGRSLRQLDEAVPYRLQRRGPDHARRRRVLQATIPGAKGQPHTTIAGGGHFLQEDKGEELARVVVDFVQSTPR